MRSTTISTSTVPRVIGSLPQSRGWPSPIGPVAGLAFCILLGLLTAAAPSALAQVSITNVTTTPTLTSVTGSKFGVSVAYRTQAAAVVFLFVEEYRNKADCGAPTGDQTTNGGAQLRVPPGTGTRQAVVFWPGARSGFPAGWLTIGARLIPGNLPDNADVSRFRPTYARLCYQFNASRPAPPPPPPPGPQRID